MAKMGFEACVILGAFYEVQRYAGDTCGNHRDQLHTGTWCPKGKLVFVTIRADYA
jgi:hypothetical protein